MNIVLTGGTGFIGQAVAEAYIKGGQEVFVTGHKVPSPEQAVSFLAKQLRPVPPVDARQLAQWIADLDSPQFAEREKASAALEKLGDSAAPPLRKLLAGRPSLESRRRAEDLLSRLQTSSPEQLRAARAVEALEHTGTEGARRLLADLAAGAPEARLTREAKAALQRLRAAGPPR